MEILSAQPVPSPQSCYKNYIAQSSSQINTLQQKASSDSHSAYRSSNQPSSSTVSSRPCKSVKFSPFISICPTFDDNEYDRTCTPMAKLTFTDVTELMQLKSLIRRQAEEVKKLYEQIDHIDAITQSGLINSVGQEDEGIELEENRSQFQNANNAAMRSQEPKNLVKCLKNKPSRTIKVRLLEEIEKEI